MIEIKQYPKRRLTIAAEIEGQRVTLAGARACPTDKAKFDPERGAKIASGRIFAKTRLVNGCSPRNCRGAYEFKIPQKLYMRDGKIDWDRLLALAGSKDPYRCLTGSEGCAKGDKRDLLFQRMTLPAYRKIMAPVGT